MSYDISLAIILQDHLQVSNAIRDLQRTGCDLTRVSVVGKDSPHDGRTTGFYHTGHRLNYWGPLGAFWGGLWGLLNGAAFFVIPGLGPVLMAGPLVTAVVKGMENEAPVPPHNALGVGLQLSRIAPENVGLYEGAIRSSQFVLFAHGTKDQTAEYSDVLTLLGHKVLVTPPAKGIHAQALAQTPLPTGIVLAVLP